MNVHDLMTIKDAIELMRRKQLHRLPVVNPDGALQGILSINEVVLHSSAEGGGENNKEVQTVSALVKQTEESCSLISSSEATPPAFDKRGYSPLERVLNEHEGD